jgi:glyoxylase-like metal-dependent hydrolase (beta-lactamase superfamily II)
MAERACVEVAPEVFVMTSTRYTTTSTVVRRAGRAVLVDPAWTVGELDSLAEWLQATGTCVACGFGTHAHHDHLLWHPAFGEAPRWASAKTVACVAEWHAELTGMLDEDYRVAFPDPFDAVQAVASDTLPDPFGAGVADERIELIVHDGHAPGHTALWLPERSVLLAGDMLSDTELPLPFNPDDLAGYLAALDALAPTVALAGVLVPGHGHPTSNPIERLDADRRYLDDVLAGGDPDDPRRALPGMADAHDRIVELARQHRQR